MFNKEDFSTPYYHDIITQIIIDTQKNKRKIMKEWDNVIKFLEMFPENMLRDELGYEIENIKIREEFVLDSYTKIYKQIRNALDKNSIKGDENKIIPILYYFYNPNIKRYWKKNNVELGEFDKKGQLNTGSAIILHALQLDWKLYVVNYSSLLN